MTLSANALQLHERRFFRQMRCNCMNGGNEPLLAMQSVHSGGTQTPFCGALFAVIGPVLLSIYNGL
jgi:hypothetical protein